MSTTHRGEALARQGHVEEGIALMRQGLTASRAIGGEVRRSYFLSLIAEAYGEVGRAAEGLTLLAEALTHVDKTGERYYEAEVYRLKGELTLTQSRVQGLGSSVKASQSKSRQVKASQDKSEVTSPQHPAPNPQAEAEACFLKAIEIARRQQAKSLELRAVMSLARLWQQQGKKEEARRMLAEIYNWFTEGFDTVDLQEAKMLLDQLTH